MRLIEILIDICDMIYFKRNGSCIFIFDIPLGISVYDYNMIVWYWNTRSRKVLLL
jgi:hypothetical protein